MRKDILVKEEDRKKPFNFLNSKIDLKLKKWISRKFKNLEINQVLNCTANYSMPLGGYIRKSTNLDLIINSRIKCKNQNDNEKKLLIRVESTSLLIQKNNLFSSSLESDKTINFILPVYERHLTFKRFLSYYEETCLKQNESTTLTVVLFQPNMSNETADQLIKKNENFKYFIKLKNRFSKNFLSLRYIFSFKNFSRSLARNLGSASFSEDSLIFFIDLDMIFNRDLLSRIRLNTIKGKQVYFPIVFSQYNSKFISSLSFGDNLQINSDFGFWRHFGYGMVSVFKSDFDRIGKFKTKFTEWGGEDADLYNRFKVSNMTIFRAIEPGLVHVYHDFHCNLIKNLSQRNSCFRSSSQTYGSKNTLFSLIENQFLKKNYSI